jgi:molybdopterin-guanine dinucleotide biosynthesis protein B
MRVVGLCGCSGAGKTTLGVGLIAALKQAGCRVSVLKHTHKRFEMDVPGKDSWRHREAGAFEVLVANRQRLVLQREYEAETDVPVRSLLNELADLGDQHWVLVEGFKHADLPRIEVWRAACDVAVQYPDDPFVVAVASPDPAPVPTGLPWLSLDDPAAVAAFLLQDPARYEHRP